VTTKAVVDSFSAVLNRELAAMRKTMTYNQGREMHGHKIPTARTDVRYILPIRTREALIYSPPAVSPAHAT
jgi:hypothetical protein